LKCTPKDKKSEILKQVLAFGKERSAGHGSGHSSEWQKCNKFKMNDKINIVCRISTLTIFINPLTNTKNKYIILKSYRGFLNSG